MRRAGFLAGQGVFTTTRVCTRREHMPMRRQTHCQGWKLTMAAFALSTGLLQ